MVDVYKAGMMPRDGFECPDAIEFPISNVWLRKYDLDSPESARECLCQPNFTVCAAPNRANQIMIRNFRYA